MALIPDLFPVSSDSRRVTSILFPHEGSKIRPTLMPDLIFRPDFVA